MIRTEDVSFRIGDFCLRQVTLRVAAGEYFVLLGPPGSGKSIFLECICGLKRVESGRVWIDEQDVTGLEPRRRAIGYVPQDYALFPHLSVEHNISFGLRARGTGRSKVGRQVGEVVEMLGIAHLLPRRIRGLSGGERQRVALARALVLRPKVLLLDEPVSTLDESTRTVVCRELQRVQRELAVATIHVSHDLEEAFSVADRAGILHQGEFQQVGPLGELLRRPGNEFVARFMCCENLFAGRATGRCGHDGATRVSVGSAEIQVAGAHDGDMRLVIRPELVRLAQAGAAAAGATALALRLARVTDRGPYLRVELAGSLPLVAHVSHAEFACLHASEDESLVAVVHRDSVHVLPR